MLSTPSVPLPFNPEGAGVLLFWRFAQFFKHLSEDPIPVYEITYTDFMSPRIVLPPDVVSETRRRYKQRRTPAWIHHIADRGDIPDNPGRGHRLKSCIASG